MGVASSRSNCGIPTKPAGGLLSNIGVDDPCLRLTGLAVLDRPRGVLRPSLGPLRLPASMLRRGPLSSALQQEWDLLPEGEGRVMRTTPLLTTFFFFFFVGQGGSSAADCTTCQRGEVVSRPLHLTGLWSGAPSSGTACSLELSLPSPAGIWFKTLLPVGGTNTAPLTTMCMSELVSWHPCSVD